MHRTVWLQRQCLASPKPHKVSPYTLQGGAILPGCHQGLVQRRIRQCLQGGQFAVVNHLSNPRSVRLIIPETGTPLLKPGLNRSQSLCPFQKNQLPCLDDSLIVLQQAVPRIWDAECSQEAESKTSCAGAHNLGSSAVPNIVTV